MISEINKLHQFISPTRDLLLQRLLLGAIELASASTFATQESA